MPFSVAPPALQSARRQATGSAIKRWLVASSLLCAACGIVHATGPVAPIRDTSERMHGITLQDPYRYMENLQEPAVQAWLKAQGADARTTLDQIPVRKALLTQLQALDEQQGDVVRDLIRSADGQVFYMKRVKGERQFKLMVRPNLTGPERLLIDPETFAKRTGVPHAINYYLPSWDGRHVAYGVSEGGSENASLYVMNVNSAKDVGTPIPRVSVGGVAWLPDSRSLTFNQLKKLKPGESDTEVYMDSQVLWLKLGQPASSAVAVFGPTVNRNLGLGRLDVGTLQFRPGSQWVLARTTDTTVPEGYLFSAKVNELTRKPVPWKKIAQFSDGVVEVELKGNDAYLLTHKNAPRNRIIKLDLNQPDSARAPDVALPPTDGVLETFNLNGNLIAGLIREGTQLGIRQYRPGNPVGESIAMPEAGAARMYTDMSDSTDALFAYGSWTERPRIWRFDGKTTRELVLSASRASETPFEIDVLDVKVKSHDGVLVPMTILQKKGSTIGKPRPTILVGYGAYGLSETARYSTADRVWIERGGIVAYVNVRGSGVYGREWYLAGRKETKPNTWKDGIACARYLIANGYASPATLAVKGGSAGGIFAGRSFTEAPELFAAAIVEVGVMDAVRAEDSANGITNVSEFGSYKDAKEFAALLAMSPYHQIKDGTAYPAILFVHGLNDPRVDVWHSAKATARLQAASNSGKPVLLRLDAQAGHGVGSTSTQRQNVSADEMSFLLWQMGQTAASANGM